MGDEYNIIVPDHVTIDTRWRAIVPQFDLTSSPMEKSFNDWMSDTLAQSSGSSELFCDCFEV